MARKMSTKQKVYTSQKFIQTNHRMRRPLLPILLSSPRLLRIPPITPLLAKQHRHLRRRVIMKAQTPVQIILRMVRTILMPLLCIRQQIQTLLPPSPMNTPDLEERRLNIWIMYSRKNTTNTTEKISLRNHMTKRWVMEKVKMRQRRWTNPRRFYLNQTSMKRTLHRYHQHNLVNLHLPRHPKQQTAAHMVSNIYYRLSLYLIRP